MFGKGDNYYRHWFLNEIMKFQVSLKRNSPDLPVGINHILKKSANKRKADVAYYYLWSVDSVKFIEASEKTGGFEQVQLTDKGRRELLGQVYLVKEKELSVLSRNNNLLVLFNCIVALGVIGQLVNWANPNLRKQLIELWEPRTEVRMKTNRPPLSPSSTLPPNLHKKTSIDTALVK